jgi:hypothetical protein
VSEVDLSFDLSELKAWLTLQPRDRSFNRRSHAGCPVAEFLRSHFDVPQSSVLARTFAVWSERRGVEAGDLDHRVRAFVDRVDGSGGPVSVEECLGVIAGLRADR